MIQMLKSAVLNPLYVLFKHLKSLYFQYNTKTLTEFPYADQTECIIIIENMGIMITITSGSDDMILITYYIKSKVVKIMNYRRCLRNPQLVANHTQFYPKAVGGITAILYSHKPYTTG